MTENEIFDAMLDEAWDEQEELLAYRAIGTVEEFKALKEKSEDGYKCSICNSQIGYK